MYARGEGVPQDYTEAYAWFSIATEHGDETAKEGLPLAGAKLTPEQLAEAQKRATQLFEQIEPADSFQSNVQNQTSGRMAVIGVQKIFRGPKNACRPTFR